MATAGLNIGLSVLKIGFAQLVQHSVRLKDAKNENAAIPPVVAAFDADFAAIVDAYNNGQATAADCIQALQYVDATIQANLRNSITDASGNFLPGTGWNASVGVAGLCNKQCTAGCCVYHGDLGPPLSLAQVALGGPGGAWGRGDPRLQLTATGGVIKVPAVFASKYGGQDRPGYTVTLARVPGVGAVQAGLLSTVDELLGNPPSALQGLLPASGATTGLSPTLLIAGVALIFGAILLAVLAGGRA